MVNAANANKKFFQIIMSNGKKSHAGGLHPNDWITTKLFPIPGGDRYGL